MKAILVKEVHGLHGTASMSVPEDISLDDVITRLAHEPGLRGLFLTDSRQRFVGVITRRDLTKWVRLQCFGETGRRDLSAWEVVSLVSARKGKDVLRGEAQLVGVKETDTLQTALDQMIASKEDIIPVLDSERRIIGDLKLSEVLLKTIEAGRQTKR